MVIFVLSNLVRVLNSTRALISENMRINFPIDSNFLYKLLQLSLREKGSILILAILGDAVLLGSVCTKRLLTLLQVVLKLR